MMHYIHSRARHVLGFTLVEMSIVLAIIGVIVAGGLTISTTLVERSAIERTQAQLETVNAAIRAYVDANSRLPCVASFTAALGAAAYGVELNCAAAAVAGESTRVAAPTGNVRIGMLPVRTLGLRDRDGADPFGNRLIYAVSEVLTTTGGFGTASNVGQITVNNESTSVVTANTSSGAAYFVFSPGSDGKGAIRYQSVAWGSCGTSANLDVQNCDFADNVFRDARFNNGTVANMFFDDLVVWMPKNILSASAASSLASTCNSNNALLTRYNAGASRMEYCNGTAWIPVP